MENRFVEERNEESNAAHATGHDPSATDEKTETPHAPRIQAREISVSHADVEDKSYALGEISNFLQFHLFVTENIANEWAKKFVGEKPPFNYDPGRFFAEIAFTYGIPVADDIAKEYEKVVIRSPPGKIPSIVTSTWSNVSISSLYEPFKGHEIADYRVWVASCKSNDNVQDLLHNLAKQLSNSDNKFLYRGVNSNTMVFSSLLYSFVHIVEEQRNEFGRGVYCTPHLDYALRFARRGEGVGGVLFVFNWSDRGGVDSKTKDLFGDEWETHVKRSVCQEDLERFNLSAPNQYYEFDILQGAILRWWPGVRMCHRPTPSRWTQVVVQNESAWRILRPRLLSIIFFE